MELIDSHCHVERAYLKGELQELLENAAANNVTELIAIGTNSDDWEVYKKLPAEFPGKIYYTVGIHPNELSVSWEENVGTLKDFWNLEHKPVGIGEIGLDYFRLPKKNEEKAEKLKMIQKMVFKAQLDIAAELACPVVIHSRSAFDDCVEMIDQSDVNWEKVVFHCFGDGDVEVKKLNDKGGRASFTGIVTYSNADNVKEALKAQGTDRLMIETDAPYLAPMPHRGKGNEPAFLIHTAECCAELLEIELDELARITTENTRSFFGI